MRRRSASWPSAVGRRRGGRGLCFRLSVTPPRQSFCAGPIHSSSRLCVDAWLSGLSCRLHRRRVSAVSAISVDRRRSPLRRARPGSSPSIRGRILSSSVSTFACFCLILFSVSRAHPATGSPCDSSFTVDPAAAAASLFPPATPACTQKCSLFVYSSSSARVNSRPTHSLTN